MEQFLETATNILMPVVLALISLGASYVILYLNKAKARIQLETDKIQDDKQKALVNGAIEQLDDVALKTINLFENTLVKELKEKTDDNKLSKDDAKVVCDTVVSEIMAQLTEDSKNLLNTQSNNLEVYIRGEVETLINSIKNKSDEIRG